MMLEVQIKEPTGGGANRTLRFPQSPVRIGRNQLNDISLEDPFVSEWHGIIRFDERSIAYFDLGSTNGTMLDGKRLAKNVGVELSATSRLQLGRLELVVSLAEADPMANKTRPWGRSDPPHPAMAAAAARRSVAPDMMGAGGGGVPAAPMPVSASQSQAVPAGGATNEALVARQRKLLEAFSEAFVGLRKGYEQFGAEVGIRTVNGTTPLHRAHNAKDVLDHLLQPAVETSSATHDLIAIYADLGIHHIAMMEGITEGVRAVLQSLDPRANDLDAGPRLFATGKSKTQWKEYLERFDHLVTDDNELHAAIFGDEFARAYASVTLGEAGGSDGKGRTEE
jgi:predicted component of type VI protein secretion system